MLTLHDSLREALLDGITNDDKITLHLNKMPIPSAHWDNASCPCHPLILHGAQAILAYIQTLGDDGNPQTLSDAQVPRPVWRTSDAKQT